MFLEIQNYCHREKRLKIRTLYYKQLLNRVNLNREKCCLMPFWKSQIVMLLRYYVDSTTHEIILSFLGKVQMEVISALLQEKYHVEIELKEPTVIYMERPLKMQNIPFTSKCRQILSGLPLVYLYHRFRWEVECSMRARFLLDT